MTQPTASSPRLTREQKIARNRAFLQDIQQLYEHDRGKIAVLKRSAGDTMDEARGLKGRGWFYYYLQNHFGGSYEREENLCLLVASLMTFDRTTMRTGLKEGAGDFGATLADLRSKEEKSIPRPGQSPLERRLVGLLDATFSEEGGGEMAYRLRKAVKFALQKNPDISILWPLLLQDVLDWHWPDKPVQKRWARSFYTVPQPDIANAELEVANHDAD